MQRWRHSGSWVTTVLYVVVVVVVVVNKEIWVADRQKEEINSECDKIGINRLNASVTLPVDVVDVNDMTITGVQLKEGSYDKRDLTTVGGELVTITGTNFGLIGEDENGDPIVQNVSVSISNLDVAGDVLGIQVELLDCKRTTSNVLIECTTPPGYGSRFAATVTVIGSPFATEVNKEKLVKRDRLTAYN